MGYFISFVTGALFGIFGMGLMAAVGNQNTYEEGYEQGRYDALEEISTNNT